MKIHLTGQWPAVSYHCGMAFENFNIPPNLVAQDKKIKESIEEVLTGHEVEDMLLNFAVFNRDTIAILSPLLQLDKIGRAAFQDEHPTSLSALRGLIEYDFEQVNPITVRAFLIGAILDFIDDILMFLSEDDANMEAKLALLPVMTTLYEAASMGVLAIGDDDITQKWAGDIEDVKTKMHQTIQSLMTVH